MTSPAKSLPQAGDLGKASQALIDRRRLLTLVLGGVWLLDAALQFQPYMFTLAFPQDVIQPAGQGSPAWVEGPVNWSASLLSSNITLWNGLFATTQLLIAVGLLWRPTRKLALLVSMAWALGVWWMGEGMGGIFAGPTSPLMGLPGGALLYAVIAVLVWPRDTATGESVATASYLGRDGSRVLWLVLWVGFAVESVFPGNAGPDDMASVISGMADGEPAWVQSINNWASDATMGRGTTLSVLLSLICLFIALAVFARSLIKPALVISAVVSLAIWVLAEDFGGIFSGSGTDPNTGPLLVLLAACYWPLAAVTAAPRSQDATEVAA